MNIKDIWLITNYSCNNRCKWCYTNEMGFPKDVMPIKFAEEVLREAAANGVRRCTLIGGEPLLYPHIFELLKYGSDIGIIMKVVTNAILLKDENMVRRLVNSGLSMLAISIHGVDAISYSANTQTDRLNDVFLAIQNMQKSQVEYTTLTTLNELNAGDIYDIAICLHKLGVQNIVYNIAVPTSSSDFSNYSLSYDKLASIIQKNYIKLKKDGIKVSFYASIPLCFFEDNILDNMINEGYLVPLSRGGCNIYDASGFAIDPFGHVIPCCKEIKTSLMNTMDTRGDFLYAGNFNNIVNAVEKYCSRAVQLTTLEECKDCNKKSDCIGGCLKFWEYDPSLPEIIKSHKHKLPCRELK